MLKKLLDRIPDFKALWAILVLLYLIPLWWFKYFPSQDGPSHLYNAVILKNLLLHKGSIYEPFFEIDWRPFPNWFNHLSLLGLLLIFPPLVAEKIFLSLYVVAFPLCFTYALKAFNKENIFLGLLAFPLTLNLFFFRGYHNFAFSLAFFFLVLGYWRKLIREQKALKWVGLPVLLALVYFTHGFTYCLSLLAVFILSFFDFLKTKRAETLWLMILVALHPAVQMANFLNKARFLERPEKWLYPERLASFFAFNSLLAFSRSELFIYWPFMILVLSLLIYGVWQMQKGKAFFENGMCLSIGCILLIFFAIYLTTPSLLGGGNLGNIIELRVCFLLFPLLILWSAAFVFKDRWQKGLSLVFFVLAVLNMGLRLPVLLEKAAYIKEYMSTKDLIRANSTLLPLAYSLNENSLKKKWVGEGVHIMLHLSGYLAVEKNLVDLDNYEANMGYFPIRYKDDKNAFRHLGGIELRAYGYRDACLELLAYQRKTGQNIDYIQFWRRPKMMPQTNCERQLQEQVGAFYERIYGGEAGLVSLYQLKTEKLNMWKARDQE